MSNMDTNQSTIATRPARRWSEGSVSPLSKPGALEAAQALLREHYTIETVADRCGYASVSGFSAAFKRMCDQTPGAWYRANVTPQD